MSGLLIAVALVAAVAALAQMVTGFGFALVSIPLLSLLTDPMTAVTAGTVLSLWLTGTATVHQRRHVDWSTTRLVTLTGLAGIRFGLVALRLIHPSWLSVLIGTVVIAFTIVLACPRSSRRTVKGSSSITAGWFSGALLASTGMNGPPIVIAFQAACHPPMPLT